MIVVQSDHRWTMFFLNVYGRDLPPPPQRRRFPLNFRTVRSKDDVLKQIKDITWPRVPFRSSF